jgi:hypothetical protein
MNGSFCAAYVGYTQPRPEADVIIDPTNVRLWGVLAFPPRDRRRRERVSLRPSSSALHQFLGPALHLLRDTAGKLFPALCTVLSIEASIMSLIRTIDRTAEQRI